jgi:hypothetical protein
MPNKKEDHWLHIQGRTAMALDLQFSHQVGNRWEDMPMIKTSTEKCARGAFLWENGSQLQLLNFTALR